MAQQRQKWAPTEEQLRLIEAAQQSGLRKSIITICKAANVPRRTFYYWMSQDRGFREMWNALHQDVISQHLPGVIAAQIHQALAGKTQAARLLAEIAGALKTRVEVSGKDGGALELTGAKERLLSRIADITSRSAAGKGFK